MLTRCLTLLIGLIAALSIYSGCANKETKLERNWGTSFESAKQSQILNPEAEKNIDPVAGLDGQAAKITIDKYRTSDKKNGTCDK